jgi:hypothetical protein
MSSVAVDNHGASEGSDMEVEVNECALGDSAPSTKGSVPKHVLSPTASTFSPKGKCKAKGAQEESEDMEDENARLREENACLHVSILGMHQYMCAQQADMLALSNNLCNFRIFMFSCFLHFDAHYCMPP